MPSKMIIVPLEDSLTHQLVLLKDQIEEEGVDIYFSERYMRFLFATCDLRSEMGTLLEWNDERNQVAYNTQIKVTRCEDPFYKTLWKVEWIEAPDVCYRCDTRKPRQVIILRRDGESIRKNA